MVAALAVETTPAPMLDVEAVFVGQNGHAHPDCPYGSFSFHQGGFGMPGCCFDQPGEQEMDANPRGLQQFLLQSIHLNEHWSAKCRWCLSGLPCLLLFAG